MWISSDDEIKEPVLPTAKGEIEDGWFLVSAEMNIVWHVWILINTPLVAAHEWLLAMISSAWDVALEGLDSMLIIVTSSVYVTTLSHCKFCNRSLM